MKHLFTSLALMMSILPMSVAFADGYNLTPLKFKYGYNQYACYCREGRLLKVALTGKLPLGVKQKGIHFNYPAFVLEMDMFPPVKKDVWHDLRNRFSTNGSVYYYPYSPAEDPSRTGVNHENGKQGRLFAWVKFTRVEDDLVEGQIRYDLNAPSHKEAIYPFRAEVIKNEDLPTVCY